MKVIQKLMSNLVLILEDNIKETLREVRMALLEADVALPVIREFIAKVKESAVGQDVSKSSLMTHLFHSYDTYI